MDLYHLVLMLLEQQDEVITVTGIHVHPLTSGAQLTNARQIALLIYLKSDVVRTRLGCGQSYMGHVQNTQLNVIRPVLGSAVYAEKGFCPCLHAVHTLMHVITTRHRRGTNVLCPCSTRDYPLKFRVLSRVTTSEPRP